MIKTHHLDGLEIFACEPTRKNRKKTPILFIHGAFSGAWMWTETFMPFLAKAGYASYAVSLRGHGGSAGHEHMDWHSIADYVDDVGKVVDWLGQDAFLVGHSMGGFVVQKYLERRAAPGVALVCSVPPQGLIAAQFHLMLQRPEVFLEINRIMEGNYADTQVVRDALFAGEVTEELLQTWLSRMQAESHRAIWDMSMFNLPNLMLMRHPPMLVLGAEQDLLVPAFLVQTTAQTYGVAHHIFRNMGHAVTHEKEWPLVAATLQHWLDGIKL